MIMCYFVGNPACVFFPEIFFKPFGRSSADHPTPPSIIRYKILYHDFYDFFLTNAQNRRGGGGGERLQFQNLKNKKIVIARIVVRLVGWTAILSHRYMTISIFLNILAGPLLFRRVWRRYSMTKAASLGGGGCWSTMWNFHTFSLKSNPVIR